MPDEGKIAGRKYYLPGREMHTRYLSGPEENVPGRESVNR